MWSPAFVAALRKGLVAMQCVFGEDAAIKEAVWENILHRSALEAGLESRWEAGSHTSGKDIWIDGHDYSCKTSKTTNDKFCISSYRLTQHSADAETFIHEVDEVRGNFDFYAVLVRREVPRAKSKKMATAGYHILVIPKEVFRIGALPWEKQAKRWVAKGGGPDGALFDASIESSMSSQLWFRNIKMLPLVDYEVAYVQIPIPLPVLSLVRLYDLVCPAAAPSDSDSTDAESESEDEEEGAATALATLSLANDT